MPGAGSKLVRLKLAVGIMPRACIRSYRAPVPMLWKPKPPISTGLAENSLEMSAQASESLAGSATRGLPDPLTVTYLRFLDARQSPRPFLPAA